MQLYHIIPPLQPYIKLICSMHCDTDTDQTHIRVLPDTCVELFVNYTSTPIAVIDSKLHNRSIITFRMSKPMDVQMRKGAGCIAICFHPGMAYPVLKIPMHTFTDTTTSLEDIWNNRAAEIEEKLAETVDNNTRVHILQQYLLQQLASNKNDAQIGYCLSKTHSSENIDVSTLTNETGLSQRHLARKFQQHVGLSTKEYLRVHRFIRSLDHLKKYPHISLTEIAYESGYYDQAHFIHDYKTYTGHTPGEVANAQHILY